MRNTVLRLAAALLCLAALPGAAPGGLEEPKFGISNPHPAMADLLHCLSGKTTLISAHRGGPAPGYPESASETFAHTLAQMPVIFETDVRTTADGVLVLMHDDTIDRTSDGHGAVAKLSWEELSHVHLKDNKGHVTAFGVPRLADVLAWMGGRGLIVLDMKEGADTLAVAKAVRAAKAEPYTGVVAYSLEQAADFHKADADITIFYPIEKEADLDGLLAAGIPAGRIVAWTGVERQNAELWRTVHRHGIPVAFGTLFFADYAMKITGNTEHYAYLAHRGVDIMPTDYPLTAFKIIDAGHKTERALGRCRALGR